MAFEVDRVIPVLRIFDVTKAREFYVDYLGLTVDWEHRFGDRGPVYMQVSRGSLVLHLSEHHGDGSPGCLVYVAASGVRELHGELQAKNYSYLNPGIDPSPGEDEDGASGPTAPARSLDAIHLATADPFRTELTEFVTLASYVRKKLGRAQVVGS